MAYSILVPPPGDGTHALGRWKRRGLTFPGLTGKSPASSESFNTEGLSNTVRWLQQEGRTEQRQLGGKQAGQDWGLSALGRVHAQRREGSHSALCLSRPAGTLTSRHLVKRPGDQGHILVPYHLRTPELRLPSELLLCCKPEPPVQQEGLRAGSWGAGSCLL